MIGQGPFTIIMYAYALAAFSMLLALAPQFFLDCTRRALEAYQELRKAWAQTFPPRPTIPPDSEKELPA